MKSSSRLALVAAAGLFAGGMAMTPAQAADLGGDCCADLEERIAELEATTVRKGNRKVSLTLSGHVNQAVVYFDAPNAPLGPDSDVYVLDNGNSMTRVRLRGSAKFKPGWSAGFYIELGIRDDNSYGVGPDPDANSGGAGPGDDSVSILIRQSNWYIQSDRLGRLTVGQSSTATDGIVEIDLSGTFAVGYFNGDGPLTTTNFGMAGGWYSMDGGRLNVVRYDSPTLAGFVFSASWGEDDYWDMALRYKREFNGVRFAMGIGYNWTNDELAIDGEREQFGINAALLHTPTGLSIQGAYNEDLTDGADRSSWYLKAGLSRRFVALGKTNLYIEYGVSDYALFDYEIWGLGMVQNIDAAAMELYIGYRHHEDDLLGGGELDVVTAGARIKF